jgi:hypothetical protein
MQRSVDTGIWLNPAFKALAADEKYLLLYLRVNPHTHLSGLYYLPIPIQIHETQLPERKLRAGLITLGERRFISWDQASEMVWVRDALRECPRSPKIIIAVAKHLASLPYCRPIIDFLKEYEALSIPYEIPYRQGIDTLTESRSEPISESKPVSASESYKRERDEVLLELQNTTITCLSKAQDLTPNHLGSACHSSTPNECTLVHGGNAHFGPPSVTLEIKSEITTGREHQKEGADAPRSFALNGHPQKKKIDELLVWFENALVPAYPESRRVQKKAALKFLRELKPDATARTAILAHLER